MPQYSITPALHYSRETTPSFDYNYDKDYEHPAVAG
jgi:hypothetical protein